MGYSLPGFSVHGILQARTLEWGDGWAECGNLALKELLAEICFPLTSTGTLQGESCALRLPFLVRTENNIHLLEVYRNIIT